MSNRTARSSTLPVAEPDWLDIRATGLYLPIARPLPQVVRRAHVVITVDGMPLLNSFDDGYGRVIGPIRPASSPGQQLASSHI